MHTSYAKLTGSRFLARLFWCLVRQFFAPFFWHFLAPLMVAFSRLFQRFRPAFFYAAGFHDPINFPVKILIGRTLLKHLGHGRRWALDPSVQKYAYGQRETNAACNLVRYRFSWRFFRNTSFKIKIELKL